MSDAEKRRESRVSFSLRFTVEVQSSREESLVNQFVECQAVDFSRHGMQLVTVSSVPSGTLLVITIGIGKPTITYRLLGEVRWSRKSDGKTYMGVQLTEADGFDLAPWITNFSSATTT